MPLLIYLFTWFILGILSYLGEQALVKEASEAKMSFEDVCKKSMALSVEQYTPDHVKVCGVEDVIRLNSKARKVTNEICKEYGYRLVNAEEATGVFHLAKI